MIREVISKPALNPPSSYFLRYLLRSKMLCLGSVRLLHLMWTI